RLRPPWPARNTAVAAAACEGSWPESGEQSFQTAATRARKPTAIATVRVAPFFAPTIAQEFPAPLTAAIRPLPPRESAVPERTIATGACQPTGVSPPTWVIAFLPGAPRPDCRVQEFCSRCRKRSARFFLRWDRKHEPVRVRPRCRRTPWSPASAGRTERLPVVCLQVAC